MFQQVRKHLNPATIIAFVALIFAATGGAFAASGGDSHGTLTASTATKKKSKTPAGKPGPRGPAGPKGATGAMGATGATGPAGPGGPAGPAGPTGPAGTGTAGTNGTNGNDGTNGVSVTSKEQASGTLGPCTVGGSEFTSASGKTYACNGKNGGGGSGTLEQGKTETGTWSSVTSSSFNKAEESDESASISFAVPLEEPIVGAHAVFVTTTEQSNKSGTNYSHCGGDVEEPKAEEGYLCVYQGLTVTEGAFSTYAVTQIQLPGTATAGAGTSGAIASIYYHGEAEGHEMRGSWAVTAE